MKPEQVTQRTQKSHSLKTGVLYRASRELVPIVTTGPRAVIVRNGASVTPVPNSQTHLLGPKARCLLPTTPHAVH